MGKSRSAAVCTAYLLHRYTPNLTPETALERVRKNRPLCEPNDGFMQQLSLYHQMGSPADDEGVTKHPLYSRWLYRREIDESIACGRSPDVKTVLFEDEQQQQHSVLPQHEANNVSGPGPVEIKCRKCRYLSFYNLLLLLLLLLSLLLLF